MEIIEKIIEEAANEMIQKYNFIKKIEFPQLKKIEIKIDYFLFKLLE